jgi:alpha-L-fucosidase
MRMLPSLLLPSLLLLAPRAAAAAATAAATVPQPTAPQLAWQRNEIMALCHFNMATFFQNGDPGCNAANWPQSQQPSSFAPAHLNVSNWIASMRDLGVKEAVLTAK